MRLLLLLLVFVFVQVGCDEASSKLENRKRLTKSAILSVTNGSNGDQAMRKLAAKTIDGLRASDSKKVHAIAFRIHPGRGRYIVSVYWVGFEKQADGLEIAFADGSKITTLFHKNKSDGNQDSLFFSAMVSSERLPEPFQKNPPENVAAVTLTKAGKKCSNAIKVTAQKPDSTIWNDAIGASINDDLELWGFSNPITSPAESAK